MTIWHYLATIDADYTNPGVKLLAFEDRATTEQAASANGLPYAIVEHLDENERTAMYGNQAVVDQVIDVSLSQEANSDGTTPDRKHMFAVWNQVQDAVHGVTANTYGRTFISLHRVTALEPRYDRETKGLFASVRFRLSSARG